MARAPRFFLLEIRSLTFLGIKIVDLMFRTKCIANIFVGLSRIRSILVLKFSWSFKRCSSALIVNNTITKFNDQYDRAADHTVCQLFIKQKKLKSRQRSYKNTKKGKESEKQLMSITF